MTELSDLFETPLIVEDVADATALNSALRTAILDRQSADPRGLGVSNRLGWHSDTRMLEWGGGAARQLAERAIALATEYTEDVGAEAGGRFAWVPEMWANVSVRGASNQFHCHAGTFWAAVYYVDDGYAGSPDRSLGGELEFEDPRMPMLLMDGPDLRMRFGSRPIADPEVLLRPAAGKLLLFPGWLRHGVRPYMGLATRISVAINLTAVRVG